MLFFSFCTVDSLPEEVCRMNAALMSFLELSGGSVMSYPAVTFYSHIYTW